MRKKGDNHLVPGSDNMRDALKLPNQGSRVSGESLQTVSNVTLVSAASTLCLKTGRSASNEGVAFLGFWTVQTVLNPISGQVFDEGHGESGVLRSAEWHDEDWFYDGIREAWLLYIVRMVGFQKFLPWLRAK
ncbi:uncharacterized protein TNCV_3757361 [Trichonephila clavipes]|nr:uncharacterized protein TNCV_3757361 [Trichonephila clavipes]